MKEKKEFKCNYCNKTFKTKVNADKHTNLYCIANPNSKRSLENKEAEEALNKAISQSPTSATTTTGDTVVKESKYTEDQQWLIKFFKGKSLSNVKLPTEDKERFHQIYTTLYNKPLNVNCIYQVVNAFTSLWYYIVKITKE